jgi:hypothetical protein
MQQSGDQCRLSALRMPNYSYVTDLTSLIRFHDVLHGVAADALRAPDALRAAAAFGWPALKRSAGWG